MPEQAPMLCAIWDDLADCVAGLVRAHPALAQRLLFAPRRAMHAYAVALHKVVADGGVPEADLAARLADTHPRALLAQALPGCSPRLYGLLDRCGQTAQTAAFYRRLHALLLGDLAPILLEADSIDGLTLDFAEALRALDPLVRRVRRALDHSAIRARAFDDVLRVLDDHGAATAGLAESLCERAGAKALAKAVRRQFDRLAMPPSGFAAPAGLRFLTTIAEVRAAGREHGNCLSDFAGRYDTSWTAFVTGAHVYLAGDDPALVLCLGRLGRWWWVEQMTGPTNAPLPAEVRQRVERDLVDAGVQLLHGDPHRALWTLIDVAKGARDGEDENEVDDEVDLAA